MRGSILFLVPPDPVLAFERELDGQRLLVAFNLSPADAGFAPGATAARALHLPGFASGTMHEGRLRLPPYGVFYGELAATQAAPTDSGALPEHAQR